MSRVESDKNINVPIREIYQQIVNDAEGKYITIEHLERFSFYEKAKSAFAIVATGYSFKK